MEYSKPADRMSTGVRYGVKSKSRIYKPSSSRSSLDPARHSLDTFSIHPRQEDHVTCAVEIGDEKFEIVPNSRLVYSLNKNKRWELIENLDRLEEENRYERERAQEERDRIRKIRQAERGHPPAPSSSAAAASVSSTSSSESDSDAAAEEDQPAHSKFHVFTATRKVVSARGTRNAERAFNGARRSHSDDDEPAATHRIVKTRKGATAVPLKKHRKQERHQSPQEEQLAAADFMITIDAKPGKHQKHLISDVTDGCRCSMCCKPTISRAHKYRGAYDQ